MKTSQICLLFCLVAVSFAQSLNSQLIESICAMPENEQLCADLVSAAVKEVRRVAEAEAETEAMSMEKRKPSFVRFGKRSDGQMEKRKPSFVRFGRK